MDYKCTIESGSNFNIYHKEKIRFSKKPKLINKKRVYLLFDHINLPQYDQYPHLCFSDYISISSHNKPNEDYKLCGSKRGVKLVTTYNNVLINYVTTSVKDFSASFSLMYRMIADPSEC